MSKAIVVRCLAAIVASLTTRSAGLRDWGEQTNPKAPCAFLTSLPVFGDGYQALSSPCPCPGRPWIVKCIKITRPTCNSPPSWPPSRPRGLPRRQRQRLDELTLSIPSPAFFVRAHSCQHATASHSCFLLFVALHRHISRRFLGRSWFRAFGILSASEL